MSDAIRRTRSRIQDAPDAGTDAARAALGLRIGTDVGAPGVVPTLTAHPTPSSVNDGLLYAFRAAGTDDTHWIIGMLANGTYTRFQLPTG